MRNSVLQCEIKQVWRNMEKGVLNDSFLHSRVASEIKASTSRQEDNILDSPISLHSYNGT